MRKGISSGRGLGYKQSPPATLLSGKNTTMAKKLYVIGGEYADTGFTQISAGQKEERYGPFDEREAHVCWRALTGKTVDNAMIRYFIRSDDEAVGEEWFVVGGEYADTDFATIASGKSLETYGPFPRQEALNKWRELTGKTVDNAMVRYFIRSEDEAAGDEWYVVGGEFADTGFEKIAAGKQLDTYGPFARQEALNKWRELTGKTVDNAMVRYDLCSASELVSRKVG